MKQINILGIKVDNITFNETLKTIDNYITSGKPKQIVTVNPEFIMAAQEDHEFKEILKKADLSVPDGSGLLFASRFILHKPIKERVTGVDLVWTISKLAAKRKYPVFFLGASRGIAEKTADKLKSEFPGLIVAGTYAGHPKLEFEKIKDYKSSLVTDIKTGSIDPNLTIINKVAKSKPKILFVAYGAPKQDKFISRYKKNLNVPVMIGVGGAFDFISGKARRAPNWMKILWIEWLWRLFNEPWRFSRIITAAIKFPLLVIKSKYIKKVN